MSDYSVEAALRLRVHANFLQKLLAETPFKAYEALADQLEQNFTQTVSTLQNTTGQLAEQVVHLNNSLETCEFFLRSDREQIEWYKFYLGLAVCAAFVLAVLLAVVLFYFLNKDLPVAANLNHEPPLGVADDRQQQNIAADNPAPAPPAPDPAEEPEQKRDPVEKPELPDSKPTLNQEAPVIAEDPPSAVDHDTPKDEPLEEDHHEHSDVVASEHSHPSESHQDSGAPAQDNATPDLADPQPPVEEQGDQNESDNQVAEQKNSIVPAPVPVVKKIRSPAVVVQTIIRRLSTPYHYETRENRRNLLSFINFLRKPAKGTSDENLIQLFVKEFEEFLLKSITESEAESNDLWLQLCEQIQTALNEGDSGLVIAVPCFEDESESQEDDLALEEQQEQAKEFLRNVRIFFKTCLQENAGATANRRVSFELQEMLNKLDTLEPGVSPEQVVEFAKEFLQHIHDSCLELEEIQERPDLKEEEEYAVGYLIEICKSILE